MREHSRSRLFTDRWIGQRAEQGFEFGFVPKIVEELGFQVRTGQNATALEERYDVGRQTRCVAQLHLSYTPQPAQYSEFSGKIHKVFYLRTLNV